MDVHDHYEEEPPSITDQVILSMPGKPCIRCLGFITDENQKKEAAQYGDVAKGRIRSKTFVGGILNARNVTSDM